jgi:hypothetical protein
MNPNPFQTLKKHIFTLKIKIHLNNKQIYGSQSIFYDMFKEKHNLN